MFLRPVRGITLYAPFTSKKESVNGNDMFFVSTYWQSVFRKKPVPLATD